MYLHVSQIPRRLRVTTADVGVTFITVIADLYNVEAFFLNKI
jgi:hypothetical protein